MGRERKFSTTELYQATKQLLLEHGYEGFTFSLLAKQLGVSRGAIYKYYENKDELVSEYMVFEMEKFLLQLDSIHTLKSAKEQFNFLVDIIFQDQEIHRLREIGFQIPYSINEKVKSNQEKLNTLHMDMYTNLQSFVTMGKQENLFKPELPNELILGLIFQTIDIPNHSHIPQDKWIKSIKVIISRGIFTE